VSDWRILRSGQDRTALVGLQDHAERPAEDSHTEAYRRAWWRSRDAPVCEKALHHGHLPADTAANLDIFGEERVMPALAQLPLDDHRLVAQGSEGRRVEIEEVAHSE
jgi:hypothetical protein